MSNEIFLKNLSRGLFKEFLLKFDFSLRFHPFLLWSLGNNEWTGPLRNLFPLEQKSPFVRDV